jgi:hypothetical protein
MTPRTGTEFGNTLRRDILKTFPQTYVYSIIGPYVPLKQISQYLKQLYDSVLCSAGEPELVSPDELGKKPVFLLTLKIHDPNSGTAIEINSMLSLMNFEEVSTSPICLDGLIGTHVLWRSKALPPVW